jgi:hypothetical protein
VILLNGQEFFRQEKSTRLVDTKFMHEHGIFGDCNYPAISVNRTSYSDEFNSFDKNRNVGYLIYEGDSPISVIGYKPALDSMFMTPIVLDSANFFNIRFKLNPT